MRFLTKPIDDPKILGAYEEALLLSRINETSPDTIWLWRHPKVMYLTKMASLNYLNRDYSQEVNYPIVRSGVFDGSTTSIVIAGNDFGLSIYCKNADIKDLIEKYYFGFWKFACEGLIDLEIKGNDLVVKDTDRKILGMVYIEKDGVSAGHCMFSEEIPGDIILEKMFKMPADKFSDKSVKSVSERITSFNKETGKLIDDEWLNNKVIEYFGLLKIELSHESDFNKNEYDIINKLSVKHLSEDWINYGKEYAKPDFI